MLLTGTPDDDEEEISEETVKKTLESEIKDIIAEPKATFSSKKLKRKSTDLLSECTDSNFDMYSQKSESPVQVKNSLPGGI